MSGSVWVYAMRSRSSRVLEQTIRPLEDDTTTPPVLHAAQRRSMENLTEINIHVHKGEQVASCSQVPVCAPQLQNPGQFEEYDLEKSKHRGSNSASSCMHCQTAGVGMLGLTCAQESGKG